MKKPISMPGYTAILMIAGILFISCGCKKDETSITGDLQTVPREPAYAGCYHIIGTSQTKCWDSVGNIITPASGGAFYGQDSQFEHITPVYTKNSNGLTVKDEVTGLTWQQSHDTEIYYWAETQTVVDNLNNENYGGYNDWRVPTIKELYSLWNASVGWPYIDTEYFYIKLTDEEE
jgi:hypothetical protein